MYKLKKEFEICCSHRLENPGLDEEQNKKVFGKCNNTEYHGHNYIVILKLKSELLINGMIRNFNEVKKIFKEEIDDIYDHKCLNLSPGFEDLIPTAENMCRVFYLKLHLKLPELYEVEIFETSGASASYNTEDW